MMKTATFSIMFFLAVFLLAGDKLWIYDNDGSFSEYEVSKIERIIFTDINQGDMMRINHADVTSTEDSIGSVAIIRFSDWYGFVGAPQNVTITADSSSVSLNWDLVNGATDYVIFRSDSGPYTGFVKIDSTSTKPYLDNNILQGKKYFYTIKARNSELK
ncbi:MAG: fibronectin type III domain-containing protein [Candidatus Delongbacteria bacterium]|nr:fibronectin type III domain-containing protein [Candidatus Delongbacteria bacterium]